MNWSTISKLGFGGAIMALLAFLFRDNPMMQGLLSMFGLGKEAAAGETGAPPASGAPSAVAKPQQVTVSPQDLANALMADWKQQMELLKTPQAIRNGIAAKEATLLLQFQEVFASTQDPQLLKERLDTIQKNAYLEAASPVVEHAKKQIAAHMEKTINEIAYNSNLPSTDKAKALTFLRKQKEEMVGGVGAGVNLEEVLGQLDAQKEAISKNISTIARNNNGLSWGSSALGWGAFALGLTGIAAGVAASFTGIGLPFGVSLATASSALLTGSLVTGAGAGVCKIVNHSGAGGDTGQFVTGCIEATAALVPLGRTGVGLVSNAMRAGTMAATGVEAGSLAYNAGVARAMLTSSTARGNVSLVGGQALATVERAVVSKEVAKRVEVTAVDQAIASRALSEAIESSTRGTVTKLTSGGFSPDKLVEAARNAAIGLHADDKTIKFVEIAARAFPTSAGSIVSPGSLAGKVLVNETINDVSGALIPKTTPAQIVDPGAAPKRP